MRQLVLIGSFTGMLLALAAVATTHAQNPPPAKAKAAAPPPAASDPPFSRAAHPSRARRALHRRRVARTHHGRAAASVAGLVRILPSWRSYSAKGRATKKLQSAPGIPSTK